MASAAIPIVLPGGAVELTQSRIEGFEWAAVMQRPFAIGAVADAVEKLLKSPLLSSWSGKSLR